MNSKTKVIFSSVGLIALVALAVFLYGTLNKNGTAGEGTTIGGTIGEGTTGEGTTGEGTTGEGTTGEGTTGNSLTSQQQNLATDFTVMDASGNMVKLSDFFGKPIVLNFWASWCPPCKKEMPEFDKVYGDLKDSVVFLMVDLTDGKRETVEIAKAYVKGQGYAFPVYFDTKGEASSLYKIDSIPQTFFIDKNGVLIDNITGGISEKALRQYIKKISQ